MDTQVITLDIHGVPVSGSQLKFNRTTGSAYRPKEHKQRVFTIYEYAKEELERRGLPRPLFPKGTPLMMSVLFRFPYRSGDYRTGRFSGQLKPNAPEWVLGNKDLDNMLKPLKDGLKGVIYPDDKQISRYGDIEKKYSEHPGTLIVVRSLL